MGQNQINKEQDFEKTKAEDTKEQKNGSEGKDKSIESTDEKKQEDPQDKTAEETE